jgi:hypothetical protein
MTDLSPAAFAVWDAAWDCPIGDCSIKQGRRRQIAAALRAAAAESRPEVDIPFALVEEWERIEGVCASFNAAVEWGHKQALAQLLAIAAELEAND